MLLLRAGLFLIATSFVFAMTNDAGFALGRLDPVNPSRDAQLALLRMGLFQLLMSFVLEGRRSIWSGLVVCSSALYALGFVARALVPGWSFPAIPLFAGLHAAAVLWLLVSTPKKPWFPKGRLWVLLLGMLVDLGLGLIEWRGELLPDYFAPVDSVRMRMLRLARMAAVALPLLASLQEELMAKADHGLKWVRRGQWGIRIGAVGMPAMLTGCALTWWNRKGGLMLLTLSMMYGVFMSARLARNEGRAFERASWLVVFYSMCVGFVISAFSFGGPFPTPRVIGQYPELPRAIIRQAHTYAIVFGIVGVVLARHPAKRSLVRPAFVGGAALTTALLLTIGVFAFSNASVAIMAGPLVVALSLAARGYDA